MKRIIISLLVYFGISFSSKLILDNILNLDFGKYFNWELAAIIQTFYSFWIFQTKFSIPGISIKHKTYLNSIISLIIGLTLTVYLILKIVIYYSQPKAISLTLFLGTDSISIIPMITFFLVNIYLIIVINKKNKLKTEKVNKYIKVLIITILLNDLFFLVPYFIIILYCIIFFAKMNPDSFLAGVSANILLGSNLLSNFLNYLIEKGIIKVQ